MLLESPFPPPFLLPHENASSAQPQTPEYLDRFAEDFFESREERLRFAAAASSSTGSHGDDARFESSEAGRSKGSESSPKEEAAALRFRREEERAPPPSLSAAAPKRGVATAESSIVEASVRDWVSEGGVGTITMADLCVFVARAAEGVNGFAVAAAASSSSSSSARCSSSIIWYLASISAACWSQNAFSVGLKAW